MRFSSNGVHITAYDIAQFTDTEFFYDEVEALVSHMKSSRTAPGVAEILIPGEPEFRTERERQRNGIPIDDTTWGIALRFSPGDGAGPKHLGTFLA